MLTTGWAVALFSLICHVFSPVSAAHSIAARAEDEVPAWQRWGPYRPGLYFGVRPQIPETFLMGLMWASGESRDEMLDSTYHSPTPWPSRRDHYSPPLQLSLVYSKAVTYSSSRYVRTG